MIFHVLVVGAERVHVCAVSRLEGTCQLLLFRLVLFANFLQILLVSLNISLEINFALLMQFVFFLGSFLSLLLQVLLNGMLFGQPLGLGIAEFFNLTLQLQTVLLCLFLVFLVRLLLRLVGLLEVLHRLLQSGELLPN